MPRLMNSIDIEAPAEDIFDYASNLQNELEWGEVLRVERIDAGPLGVGTKFLAEWKGSGPHEVEIIAFERPRRWSAIGPGMKMDINVACEVLALDACRSRLTATMDLIPHGGYRLLTPILVRVMQKVEQKNLTSLKGTIERKRAEQVVRSE